MQTRPPDLEERVSEHPNQQAVGAAGERATAVEHPEIRLEGWLASQADRTVWQHTARRARAAGPGLTHRPAAESAEAARCYTVARCAGVAGRPLSGTGD